MAALRDILKDYFVAVAGAAALALLLRIYVVEAFRIPTDFMAPALLPGDHIFVNKLAYLGVPGLPESEPAKGDIVIFGLPNDPGKDFIKRVVGVGGDEIAIRGGEVRVNGAAVSRPVGPDVFEETLGGRRYRALWEGVPREGRTLTAVKVPPGQLFVLGDNRAKGQDSRNWGFLPAAAVKGRAAVIWFSRGLADATRTEYRSEGVRWGRMFTRIN